MVSRDARGTPHHASLSLRSALSQSGQGVSDQDATQHHAESCSIRFGRRFSNPHHLQHSGSRGLAARSASRAAQSSLTAGSCRRGFLILCDVQCSPKTDGPTAHEGQHANPRRKFRISSNGIDVFSAAAMTRASSRTASSCLTSFIASSSAGSWGGLSNRAFPASLGSNTPLCAVGCSFPNSPPRPFNRPSRHSHASPCRILRWAAGRRMCNLER